MGSVSDGPVIVGELKSHPQARALADVVKRVHHRYATEIVDNFQLCPFMKDPESAFGRFVVVLSRELDVGLAAQTVVEADVQVVHLIYPLTTASPASFERFGNEVHQRVASADRTGPVHASFHPQMAGDPSSAAKLVGFVRRAPDPFIQFIPEGLHKGGSTFVDASSMDLATLVKSMPPPGAGEHNAKSNFGRLSTQNISQIQETIANIHADRHRSYANYLEQMGCA